MCKGSIWLRCAAHATMEMRGLSCRVRWVMRIVRQLLVESVLLAVLGGALGLLAGIWGVNLLTAALPDTITFANLKTIRIDSTVFLFTVAVSLVTGVVFGLVPAFRAARADLQVLVKEGGREVAAGRSVLRSALVVAEVALSIVLLTGAGLLMRSFVRLTGINPGFDSPHVLSMQLAVAGRYDTDQRLLAFVTQMLERVRSLPGVEAAGTSHFLPLGRIIPSTGFWRGDHPRPGFGEEPVTEVLVVMPGYFAAMNIPLVRGRVFTDQDRAGAPLAVVVNQTLVRQFYPNENPVGNRLYIDWRRPNETYQIVGVVGDVHQKALDQAPKPGLFFSNLQEPTDPVYLTARTHGDPRQLVNAIRQAIHALDREIPIADVATMDEYVSSSVAAPRFNTILLSVFAFLALVLAAVGIFGVISYSVSERTQEIGLRLALGAETGAVMRLVIAQAMPLAALGVAIGLAGAFGLTRVLQGLLFGVTPTDPLTFAAVAGLLGFVALLAGYVPARRAAQVDRLVALRHE